MEQSPYTIVVEGRLYDFDGDMSKKMDKLIRILFQQPREDSKALTNWLLNTDGDFIIFVLNKDTNEIRILNDVLGRLPLYYSKHGETIIMSREVRFLAKLLDERKYDRLGIAQCLLFGYPLGTRTLLEGIQRLPPASLVRIGANTSETTLESLYTFNFDSKRYADRTVQENAAQLVTIFRESCRQRADLTGSNIVSLSGGLDSRSVAVGLYEEGVPLIGVTHIEYNEGSPRDVTCAGLLSKLYGWDWETYHLGRPRGRHLLQLLRTKNGLNHFGVSYMIEFLEKIRESHSRKATYFTGDGGLIVRDLKPTRPLRRLEDVADRILQELRTGSSLETVAALTQLDSSAIKKDLIARLASYPERDLMQKYVHFVVYDKILKWLFEGEDRNRFYFWSVAPLYSIRFFDYVMNCPDGQKPNYLLYRHFLVRLSRPASEIPDSNVGLRPISVWHGLIRSGSLVLYREWLPPSVRVKLKHLVSRTPHSYDLQSSIIRCLRDQLKDCDAVRVHLNAGALEHIIDHCQDHSRYELENLFTVTSIIEDFERGESSIENYGETQFL